MAPKATGLCVLPITFASLFYCLFAVVTVIVSWTIWGADSAIVAGSNFPRGAFVMGIFVAVLSLVAIYGVQFKMQHVLRFYAGMLSIVIVIELALGAIALVNGIMTSGIALQLSDGWDRYGRSAFHGATGAASNGLLPWKRGARRPWGKRARGWGWRGV